MTQMHDRLAEEEASHDIDVSTDDLDSGVREDCWRCPIANAVNRLFPGLHAQVDAHGITVYEHDPVTEGPGRPVWFTPMPDDALDYMFAVDEKEPVGPAKFRVTFRRI